MKSIKEIKDSLKAAATQLEIASSALDTVERDGHELKDIRRQLEEQLVAINDMVTENESNVDEVRVIKEQVEDAYLTISAAVQDMDTQAEILMKEVTVQTIMNTNTGQFTFRIIDPKAATLASLDGPATSVEAHDSRPVESRTYNP